jgi:phospholipid N-methyltransferase
MLEKYITESNCKINIKSLYKCKKPDLHHQDRILIEKKSDFEILRKCINHFKKSKLYYGGGLNFVETYQRYIKIGIETKEDQRKLFKTIRSIINPSVEEVEEIKKEAIKTELETKLRISKIDGFFPTPTNLINEMIDQLDIKENDQILEPSSGKGDILKELLKSECKNITGLEINYTLNEYIKKVIGFDNCLHSDFLNHDQNYNKIIMNPPFEKQQDIDHINHAFKLLKDGGRLVAICSESPFFRDNQKSIDFREMIDQYGESFKNDENTFKGGFVSTGVNTRIVILNK